MGHPSTIHWSSLLAFKSPAPTRLGIPRHPWGIGKAKAKRLLQFRRTTHVDDRFDAGLSRSNLLRSSPNRHAWRPRSGGSNGEGSNEGQQGSQKAEGRQEPTEGDGLGVQAVAEQGRASDDA